MPRNYDIRKLGPKGDESCQEFPNKGTGQILNELSNLIFRSSIRAYSSVAGVQVVEAWVLRKIGYKKVISAREIAVVWSKRSPAAWNSTPNPPSILTWTT